MSSQLALKSNEKQTVVAFIIYFFSVHFKIVSCIRYHIPRSFLKPKDNLLVIFEEEAVSPDKIAILTVNRDTICSLITENHPPNIKSFASKNQKLEMGENLTPEAFITCPDQKKITAVEFASFGDPSGFCGNFTMGKCNAPSSKKIVEQVELSFLC